MTAKARICVIGIITLASYILLGSQTSRANFDNIAAIGFRSGVSVGSDREDFQQYEAFLNYKTWWEDVQFFTHYKLSMTVNLSTGTLTTGAETEFIGSVGPRLVLGWFGSKVTLDGGISATVLGNKRFGDENFGGQYQFTSHIGTNIPLRSHVILNFRFQHMSNASLREPNPGLNMFLFGLSYAF